MRNFSLIDENFSEKPLENSQLINLKTGFNRLMINAAPLFALVKRSHLLRDPLSDKSALLDLIINEIEVFLHKVRETGYQKDIITKVLFALCAFLDEMILPRDSFLLDRFCKDQINNEDFFSLLDIAYQDARLNLDLLEFFYFCLRLGFMGKFRFESDGMVTIERISNFLYSMILKHHPEFSPDFFIEEKSNDNVQNFIDQPNKKKIWEKIVIFGLFFAALTAITLIYLKFSDRLNGMIENLF